MTQQTALSPFPAAAMLAIALSPTPLCAAAPDPLKYEDPQVTMRLVIRSQEQLSAFYQGREFSPAAIEKILATCFITPLIKNKTLDVLWLELDHWQFKNAQGEPINRLKRDYWTTQWDAVALPQAYRSTFGWTLMPEVRDLRLDEGVGGSVVIPMQTQPITLIANFHTGSERNGPVKTIVFKDIRCPDNKPTP